MPLENIDKCLSLIASFLTRMKVTLKEVQSLTGMLRFACSLVFPGRAFLRRLIDLTVGIHSLYHFIRIYREAKADLKLWQLFSTGLHIRSFVLEDFWNSSDKLKRHTDVSLGFKAVCGRKWCYGRSPDTWLHQNIVILQFYPIVLSLYPWGCQMQNRSILFAR